MKAGKKGEKELPGAQREKNQVTIGDERGGSFPEVASIPPVRIFICDAF